MACSRPRPRTFAVLGRMFDCLPIHTLVTPASTSTLLRTRQRDAVLWSGGPFHFLWHSAWLSWSRSGLDKVADQMLRSVQFFSPCRSLGEGKWAWLPQNGCSSTCPDRRARARLTVRRRSKKIGGLLWPKPSQNLRSVVRKFWTFLKPSKLRFSFMSWCS